MVDDFEPWRRFVKTVLALTPEWKVSGEARNGADALAKAQQIQPDLVLLDMDLPDNDGIEIARQLQLTVPNAKIVFLTAESSSHAVSVALKTGALGYVLKSQVVDELLPALASVFSDKRFISKGLTL
jgi:two-component system nitrate/nitrite response regulator NarL